MTTKKKTPTSVLPEGARHSSFIRLGERDLELVLTTRATREIVSRYGGLEQLGDTLESSSDVGEQIGEICWLIALLANQSVLIYNLTHQADAREEITPDMVELLTVPGELAGYKDAITAALEAGMRREVASPKA